MKALTIQNSTSIRKSLIYLFFLLCSLTLSSYKGRACNASFAYYGGGLNGYWTFACYTAAANPGTLYYWNMGDGSGWQQGNTIGTFNHIYAANGTYIVKLAIQDSACIDTATETIYVSNVTSSDTTGDSTGCNLAPDFTYTIGANGQVTFNSTTTGANANSYYSWYMGNGTGSSYGVADLSTSYTYSINGTYNVTLYVLNFAPDSCNSTVTIPVTITNIDSTTHNDSTTCNLATNFTYHVGTNGQVTFNSASTGVSGTSWYSWSMGDGTGSSYGIADVSTSYTYSTNGTYSVTLSVQNSSPDSCWGSVTILVTINNADSTNHNDSTTCNLVPSFICTIGANGQVTFNSTSTGVNTNSSYSWYMGDGTGYSSGIADASTSYTYSINGTYHVTLYIANSASGSCLGSITIPVTITNADSTNSNDSTGCNLVPDFTYTVGANGQVTFNSTSMGVNANSWYYWYMGTGTGSSSGVADVSTSYTYSLNGTYYVRLYIINSTSDSCYGNVTIPVTITNADSTNNNDSTGCNLTTNFAYNIGANGQVTFNSTSTGVNSNSWYSWNMGDGTGSSYGVADVSTSYTYTLNGTYNVTLSVQSSSPDSCWGSVTIPVTITNADSTNNNDTTGCNLNVNFTYQYDSTGQVQFTSTSTGVDTGAQYIWMFGDGTSATGYNAITHDYTFNGSYNVTLTVTNSGGCTESVTETITIYNQDSLQASFVYYSQDSITPGDYYFISTSHGANANTYYKWTPGDGSPADSGIGMTTYTHIYSTSGPVSATLTIWYTVLPHGALTHAATGRYDESSYTTTINVTTVATGVKTVADTKTYDVYPNPNNGSFKIAVNGLAAGKTAEIRISNMMGQIIYQSTASVSDGNTLSDISLPNAASGLYLLQVITSDNTYTSRIAIQK